MKRSRPIARNVSLISCQGNLREIEIEQKRMQNGSAPGMLPAYPYSTLNKNGQDILEGGLLFEVLKNGDKTTSAPVARMALNGMGVKSTNATEFKENIEKLEDTIRYIGVSIKDVVNCFDGTPNNDSPVVATSGYVGVTNTSNKKFQPGDIVCWKMPEHGVTQPIPDGQREVDNHRKVLETVPYVGISSIIRKSAFIKAASHSTFTPHTKEALSEFAKMNGICSDEQLELVAKFCLRIATMCASHVVGVAQQSAGPGETFGVVISPPVRNVFATLLNN